MPSDGRLGAVIAAIARALARLSLRARLLLALVLIAAVGLIAADFVVYSQIQSYLGTQIDQQIERAAPNIVPSVVTGSVGALDRALSQAPIGTYVAVLDADGNPVRTATGLQATSIAHLAIPRSALASAPRVNGPSTAGSIFDASVGGTPYRALVYSTGASFTGATYVIVAIPLSSLNGTLHQLIGIDLAVTAGVLLVLVALGYAVVRAALRPLGEIGDTADAIAGGDLSRRVDFDDPRTEVGRLGGSLNVMLSRIEHAFAEQQASEQRLRRFLTDASHELRTPVTSIRGYAELFRRGAADDPEDLALAMRRIEDESIRMGGLVDDLLLLARLDQGRPLERRPVDLAELVTDAAADAQLRAPERTISLHAAPVTVEGDEQRLRQIVLNLLENAVAYTESDVAIDVVVRADGGKAVVVVADEGEGIPSEDAARVFERFFRADASRARSRGGSGLGLSIVASIAEAHGGRAYLDTNRRSGAAFVVELPRHRIEYGQVGNAESDGRADAASLDVGPTSESN